MRHGRHPGPELAISTGRWPFRKVYSAVRLPLARSAFRHCFPRAAGFGGVDSAHEASLQNKS